MKQQIVIYGVIAIVAAASGALAVYRWKPRIVTQTQIVTQNTVQDHIVTVTKEVVQPNGAKEIDTTITNNTVQVTHSDDTVTKAPMWHVDLGVNTGINLLPSYSLQVERRIAGPLWIGARAETRGAVGVVIGLEF